MAQATRERAVLDTLADGAFHSGEDLARAIGTSRAAVWKIVRGLQARGFDVHSVRGRGYRLGSAVEWLDATAIRAAIPADALESIDAIDVLPSVDSTNTWLTARAKAGAPAGAVCLAEAQSAGRGRSGRHWHSPAGANLYLSLLWRFGFAPAQLSGLSLAVGVAVVHALERFGVADIGLKWPNDVVAGGRKLGGVLLEFGGESGGPCHVVIGIGINLHMPASAVTAIDQPWTDFAALGGGAVSRNRLAATLIGELAATCRRFADSGFAAFTAEWQRYDIAMGQAVRLSWPGHAVEGVARGVDATGALLLEADGTCRSFAVGELSLRLTT